MRAELIQNTLPRRCIVRLLVTLDRIFGKEAGVKNSPPAEDACIMLVGSSHLGDVLCFFPFLRWAERVRPKVKFHFAGPSALAGLAKRLKLNATFHSMEADPVASPWKYAAELRGLRKSIRPDVSVTYAYENSPYWLVVQRFAGAPRRFGFADKGLAILLTDPVVYPSGRYADQIHSLFSALFGEMSLTDVSSIYQAWLRETPRRSRSERSGGEQIIALAESANHPFVWPDKNWHDLLERLSEKYPDTRFALFGNSAPSHRIPGGETWMKRLDEYRGRTSLEEVFDLFLRCDVLVAVDTGLRHLANLAGLPAVVLRHSQSDNMKWGQYSADEIVLTSPQPCSPCGLRACRYDSIRCMTGISVADCLSAVDKALNKPGTP